MQGQLLSERVIPLWGSYLIFWFTLHIFFCLFSFYFLFLSVLCDSVGFLVTFWLLWEGGGGRVVGGW